jgi:hypothetical protein
VLVGVSPASLLSVVIEGWARKFSFRATFPSQHARTMKHSKPPLTKAFVSTLLSYDSASGVFYWLKGRLAGRPAGTTSSLGYIKIMIGGQCYQAHRLAFLLTEGVLPPHDVDHINGVRHDNRWCNLRAVSRAVNAANRHRANKNSSSGLLGAAKHRLGCWVANAIEHGVRVYLGTYKTPGQASAAYKAHKERKLSWR